MEKRAGALFGLFLILFLISPSFSVFSGSIIAKFSITADDSWEAYFNGTELQPADKNNSLPKNCDKFSKYCCGPVDVVVNNISRCDWRKEPEVYKRQIQNGDILKFTYYNAPTSTHLNMSTMTNPFLSCVDNSEYGNPSAFMTELTSDTRFQGNLSLSWVCAPGPPSDLLQANTIYSAPKFAGFNVPGAWSNLTEANQTSGSISCANKEGDSRWGNHYKKTYNTAIVKGFSSSAFWLYNEYPNSTTAHCIGTIHLSFPATSILVPPSPNPSSFSFSGTSLVLNGDVALPQSSSIVVQTGQLINFTDSVTFSGALIVTVGSALTTEQSVTPIVYQSRANRSEFSEIQVISEGSEEEGCSIKSRAEYGANGLNVLFHQECETESEDGVRQKVIIGVVVGVGGLVMIMIGIAIIVLAVVAYKQRKALQRAITHTTSNLE